MSLTFAAPLAAASVGSGEGTERIFDSASDVAGGTVAITADAVIGQRTWGETSTAFGGGGGGTGVGGGVAAAGVGNGITGCCST